MHHLRWEDALTTMYRAGDSATPAIRTANLGCCIGAVLAEDVYSPMPLPHYDSSAMDGYAVSGQGPWRLLTQEFLPQQNRHRETLTLADGQATPILTGGLIPQGTTAIVRQENARHQTHNGTGYIVSVAESPAPGADIRRTGEELPRGATLVTAGTLLTSRHIALLAVSGIDFLEVLQPPKVALAFTGNEVITSGIPAPGEVRDAYSLHFPWLIQRMGAHLYSTERLHDSSTELHTWLDSPRTADAQVLILTGGSSTSEVDFVRTVLTERGASYLFPAVAVRPGHPCLAAQLPDGRIVMGLPGNPLAAHVSLYSYLPHYIAGYLGQEPPQLLTATATNTVPSFKKNDVRLIPASYSGGKATVLLKHAQSHMLSALAQANTLAVIPPDGVAPGSTIKLLSLPSE